MISADGRSVAFVSYATDLDGVALGDLRYFPRAFVRDLEAGTTELVDVPRLQPGTPDGSAFEVALSGDGRVVAFGSYATNLVSPPPAETAWGNLYVRNRDTGKTILATALDPLATGCTIGWGGSPCSPGSNSELSLSADGRWLSFISYSQRLLPMSFTHAPQACSTRWVAACGASASIRRAGKGRAAAAAGSPTTAPWSRSSTTAGSCRSRPAPATCTGRSGAGRPIAARGRWPPVR